MRSMNRKKTLRLAACGLAVCGVLAAHGMGRVGGLRDGSMRVVTDPRGALITLDGIAHGTSPATIETVEPGRHLLIVRKEGYHEVRRTVVVGSGEQAAADITLEEITGLLLVRSRPSGAEVTIDGAYRGKTPFFITDCALGEHRVQFTAPGYKPKETVVTVSDRTPRLVELSLASDSGRIRFVSQPPGAAVFVNAARRGVTPMTLDRVPGGDNTVRLSLDGYEPHTEKVNVVPGNTYDVHVQLKPRPGILSVVTMPAKARIYIDNEFRGEAPVEVQGLEPRKYRVRAELAGHEPDARDVVIRRAEKTIEEFRLVRNSGVLLLVTEPAGVKVYVDGRYRGKTEAGKSNMISEPLEVGLLPAGRHVLQLSRKGYKFTPRNIVIRGTEIVNLHEKLTREFVPDTIVRTGPGADDARKGVLLRKHPNGDVELEVRPGIIEKIEASRIYGIEPLRTE